MIRVVIGALERSPKVSVKGLEDLEIRGQIEAIIKIDQNIEKSPGDSRRLAVTQTSMRNNQPMLH